MDDNQKKAIIRSKIESAIQLMSNRQQAIDIITDYFTPAFTDVQPQFDIDEYVSALLSNPLSYFLDEDKFAGLPEGVGHNDTLSSIDSESRLNYIISLIDFPSTLSFDTYVIVHFPSVRVTNENDRHIDITHLYVIVYVRSNGCYHGLKMNRSEYTMAQFRSSYCHSHLPSIPINSLPYFQDPCFGSGPIRQTTSGLYSDFDADQWGLFCFELEKYVTQESIAGTPYKYLESVGRNERALHSTLVYSPSFPFVSDVGLSKSDLDDFLSSFLQTVNLPVAYSNSQFILGCPDLEFIILLSNHFISWFNNRVAAFKSSASLRDLIIRDIICPCIITNNRIYSVASDSASSFALSHDGDQLFLPNHKPFFFHNQPVRFHVSDAVFDSSNVSHILTPSICSYLLTQILSIINRYYDPDNLTSSAA